MNGTITDRATTLPVILRRSTTGPSVTILPAFPSPASERGKGGRSALSTLRELV
jgi:hypothetical protein